MPSCRRLRRRRFHRRPQLSAAAKAARLAEVIAAWRALDAAAEPQRGRELLAEAITLADRQTHPARWAALHQELADLCAQADPLRAIACYEQALEVWQRDEYPGPWVHAHAQLGLLLAPRHPPGSAGGEAAIDHLEQALEGEPTLARLLATLHAFRPLGDLQHNWQRRMHCLGLAAAQADDLGSRARLHNEAARAWAEEPGADAGPAMDRRIAAHEAVLASVASDPLAAAATALDLADALLNRGRADDASRAEGLLNTLLAEHDPPSPMALAAAAVPVAQLLLARCLIFHPGPAPAAPVGTRLDRALPLLKAVAERTRADGRTALEATAEKFSALALLKRAGGTRDPAADLAAIHAHLDTALAYADARSQPDERRILLQMQAEAHGLGGRHDDACAPLEEALGLAESLLAAQTSTAGRLERIWEFRDSAAQLAGCHVRGRRLAAAWAALERGKARLWAAAAGPAASGGNATAIDPAPAGLAQGGALLAPLLTDGAGWVLTLTATRGSPTLDAVPLPDFDRRRALALLRGDDPAQLGGWLWAYSHRRSQRDVFAAHIDALGRELHGRLWSELLPALREAGIESGAELVWLPQAGTGVLPVHAAWCEAKDGGRDWLIDSHALRYAPSLHLLERAARPQATGAPDDPVAALIVSDPTSDLPDTALEAELVGRALAAGNGAAPAAVALHGPAATADALRAVLPAHRWLHYAGHAEFDVDDPLHSRLLLADESALTIAALAAALSHGTETVVLSACDTAVTRATSLLDEALGFPAALLAAGARRVLATQWSVSDASSALLIGRWYEHLDGGRRPAAQALREAQRWLRDATAKEGIARLRALRDASASDTVAARAAEAAAELRARDPSSRPWSGPWHWAGYTAWGAST
ncbi:MAG: CHAT domain-containing protein [Rubrivivax sp.]|nr:CHAT domain-containing protein [Rubrivivax sp.]